MALASERVDGAAVCSRQSHLEAVAGAVVHDGLRRGGAVNVAGERADRVLQGVVAACVEPVQADSRRRLYYLAV